MAPYKTSSPLLSLPSAANGVTVTPPGISEGWSDWVELTPAAASDMRIATIIALPGTRATDNFYEVEIGAGSLGNETPVCAVRGYSGNNAGGPADYDDAIQLGVLADVITTGQRVSARLRQTSTATTPWLVSMQYWALPMTGNVVAATVGQVNVPSGSRLSVTSSGTPNTYGSWVEIASATDAEWVLGNVMGIDGNFSDWELQFGTGLSGSEVPLWSVKSYGAWFINANAWQGGPWNILLRPPLGPVPAGTRLAARLRSGNGARTLTFGLSVTKQAPVGVASSQRMAWSDWVTVTAPVPGGLANFSSWVTAIATTPYDLVLTGVAKTSPSGGRNRVQIAIGAQGEEVVFANCYVLNGIFGGGNFNFPFPYGRFVPAGSRVAIRYAVELVQGGINTSFTLSHQEVSGGVPDFDNWTNGWIQDVYYNPVGAPFQPFTLVCGSPAWADGAWNEIEAVVPVDRVITAYMTDGPEQTEYEIDFGVGAPGSEVVVTTLRDATGCDASGGAVMHDVFQASAIIPQASRFSMRARGSTAGMTVRIAPHYTAEPVDTPSISALDHDCETGIFTITGQNLLTDGAELSSVTRDDVEVGFAVLTQTDSVITFQLTEAFVDGTYCVVVTNDVESTDPFCGDFTCDTPSCLALTDDPTPVPPDLVCLPIVDGDWVLAEVRTESSGLDPDQTIVTQDGAIIQAFIPGDV